MLAYGVQTFAPDKHIDREAQRQRTNPVVVFVVTLTLTAGAAQKLMLFLELRAQWCLYYIRCIVEY